MALNFETSTPKKLLADFKKAIDNRHVVTWAYDAEGDFYHTPQQSSTVGWLRPSIYEGNFHERKARALEFGGHRLAVLMRQDESRLVG